MGEPLKLLGHMTAGYFEFIDIELSIIQEILFSFEEKPPKTEQEWIEFYRRVIRAQKRVAEAKRNTGNGREVAKANKVIAVTNDHKRSARELIEKLQTLLSELEEHT